MNHLALVEIAIVLALGIAAQWIAWRFGFPSILLLLLLGIVAGPVTGLVDADALLGDLLVPLVSISVALILFEGGLSLNLRDIGGVGDVVRRLISVGALVSFVIIAVAAWGLLGFEPSLAILFGAILSVTGPTVIGPLLRQVRPRGKVGAVLQWEGILIDPVGAMLAVLVFEAIVAGDFVAATSTTIVRFVTIVGIGSAAGAAGALALIATMRRYLVPDYLRNAATLALVVAAFVTADSLASESGLLAVTVMGVMLANQRSVPIHDIVEFKEHIGVLLLALLFILLGSRLELSHLAMLDGGALLFLGVLVFVARPAGVWLSTIRSKLTWRERTFIMAVAPRGIVAAAVSSVFALKLEAAGLPGASLLVPFTFATIIATVLVYGLTARPFARLLGLAAALPHGVLVVGAHGWARELARAIAEAGGAVLMVDANWTNVVAARALGLTTHFGSVLDDEIESELELSDIGSLLCLTSNDAVNTLACVQFQHRFGRGRVFRLQPAALPESQQRRGEPPHRGRPLFAAGLTHAELERRFDAGATIRMLGPGEEGELLVVVRAGGQVIPISAADLPPIGPSDVVIALIGGRRPAVPLA